MGALEHRVALVTGASSGIGEAIARALADEGATLILAARRESELRRVASELPGARVVVVDVRDADALRKAFEREAIDVCVANAGLGRGLAPIQDGDPADWKEMLDTNVLGVLNVLRAVTPGMVARKSGDVVLLGSVAGRQVYPGGNVYCASKFAVRGIYESLRIDLFDKGVRCTTVDPGMVRTDFSKVRFHGDAARADKVYAGVDYLLPEDIADIVRFVVTRPPPRQHRRSRGLVQGPGQHHPTGPPLPLIAQICPGQNVAITPIATFCPGQICAIRRGRSARGGGARLRVRGGAGRPGSG
jgi:NADP-dependent 3-hydroxy acid dehydrogenase YdfG